MNTDDKRDDTNGDAPTVPAADDTTPEPVRLPVRAPSPPALDRGALDDMFLGGVL